MRRGHEGQEGVHTAESRSLCPCVVGYSARRPPSRDPSPLVNWNWMVLFRPPPLSGRPLCQSPLHRDRGDCSETLRAFCPQFCAQRRRSNPQRPVHLSSREKVIKLALEAGLGPSNPAWKPANGAQVGSLYFLSEALGFWG